MTLVELLAALALLTSPPCDPCGRVIDRWPERPRPALCPCTRVIDRWPDRPRRRPL